MFKLEEMLFTYGPIVWNCILLICQDMAGNLTRGTAISTIVIGMVVYFIILLTSLTVKDKMSEFKN